MERLACLIVGRNLGDAVIQSGFLRALRARGYAERYLIWTRPQVGFLFEQGDDCLIIPSSFPVGTNKQFDRAGARQFFSAAARIRALRPSVTIDLIGDFRERIFAAIAGSRRHLHIGWSSGHPFNRIIRNPLGKGSPLVEIPADMQNIYAAYAAFLDRLIPASVESGQAARPRTRSERGTPHRLVGLHPFASQASKLWPDQHWRDLATRLQSKGHRLMAFGAPSERSRLMQLFADIPDVELVTEPLPVFARRTTTLDLLIGLDSFSVHMAAANGVPSIMLSAGNHPTLWAPPTSTVLHDSAGCAHFPCYNTAPCEKTSQPHQCIKALSVARVAEATRNRFC